MAVGGGASLQHEKPSDTYSSAFAFAYIFNLVIGVGALTLPQAFSKAGIILGTILLVVLAFMSYMTATFMVEAMAAANAYVRHMARKGQIVVEAQSNGIQSNGKNNTDCAYGNESTRKRSQGSRSPSLSDERTPLVPPIIPEGIKDGGKPDDKSQEDEDAALEGSDDYSSRTHKHSIVPTGTYTLPAGDYEIDRKFEMGTMANMFYHPVGIILYYIAICLYLYGDLAIYAVAIPKSLVVVACTKPPNDSDSNISDIGKFDKDHICFHGVNEHQAYYIFLSIVSLFLCPWTFFNLTKSKYMQLFTTILRNLAFIMMVVIAVVKLAESQHATPSPSLANVSGFPTLFGVSIYAFMCQHSLPGMITPMKSKRGVFVMVFADFALILFFYLLLAYTGAYLFAVDQLNDLYTLNFFRQFSTAYPLGDRVLAVLGYYLALFPVFTLSTNFPIISITLRENLKALALISLKYWRGDKPFHWAVNLFLFPVLAVGPAIALAFGTYNVSFLVGITGSFPGIAVQYVIPATLAFSGKYIITRKLGMKYESKYKSPFSYLFFLVVVLVWTVVCVGLTITEDIIKIIHHKFFN